MGKIKQFAARAEARLRSTKHKKAVQGAMGVFVMAAFVVSSFVFSGTVQALIQSAGSYGYYSGSYGFQSSVTADALPATPSSMTCSGTAGGSTATCTVVHTGLTTTGTSVGTLTASVTVYSGSTCSGSSVATGSASGTTSIGVSVSGLTAGSTYCADAVVTDAASNQTSSVSTTGVFIAASSGGLVGSGGVASSVNATTATTTTTTTTAVTGGETGERGLAAATITGQLGGTAAQALAVIGVTGTQAAQATATANAAAQLALVGADVAARNVLTNALALAASQNVEISTARGTETAATRLANFLTAVVQADALATARANPAVATAIAEHFVAPAATGSMVSNLRRATLDRMLALGVSATTAQQVNVDLEKREKQFSGIYLAFYGSTGPANSAQWSSFLNSAHGARVLSRDLSTGGTEVQALARYRSVTALNRAPFGPLPALDAARKGTGAAAVRAQEYYSIAFNLIQNAGKAAKDGVRALPR